jgi:hypothetical protein
MTATRKRTGLNRITVRRAPGRSGPDFAKAGQRGKLALGEKILALRDSGPVHVLEWVNDDRILWKSFRGLERLGRATVTVTKTRFLHVEKKRTFTVIELHHHVVAQFNVIGASRNLRDFARRIIDELALAPAAWLARLRRCAYQDCDRPFFWDSNDAADKKHCSEAHKKAAGRQLKHQP